MIESQGTSQDREPIRKPAWRTPIVSTNPIAHATRTYYSPGIDAFVETTTPSAGS